MDLRKGRHWHELAGKVRERDDYRCQRCGAWGKEVDHKVPVAEGGGNDPANLQVLCRRCHKKKTRAEVNGHIRGRV